MGWSIGSAIITVLDKSDTNSQIIARLQPLASGTVHHIFGYEDQVTKLSAIVVGSVDKNLLAGYTKTATSYTLQSDSDGLIVYGDFYIKSATFKHEPVRKQSIRQDLSCTAPVYSTELELYRDLGT